MGRFRSQVLVRTKRWSAISRLAQRTTAIFAETCEKRRREIVAC